MGRIVKAKPSANREKEGKPLPWGLSLIITFYDLVCYHQILY